MEDRKPRNRGLGRGLDALFGDEEVPATLPQDEAIATEASDTSSGRKVMSIGQIIPNPDQPRRFFDEKALAELASSITEHGLLQPILVRPSKTQDNHFEIIAGERRWRASQRAQLHEIPVIIRDFDDEQTYQIALVENLQRKDLNPIEEGKGYQKLIDDFNETPETVGKVVGKSRSYVTNMMRLLALPESVMVMVEVGDITAGHARALLGSENPYPLAIKIIKESLSVRAAEKLVAAEVGRDIQKRDTDKPKKQKGFAKKDADLLALEKDLSDALGMNAVFDMKNDSAGKISVEFKNLDQLDEILKRLGNS